MLKAILRSTALRSTHGLRRPLLLSMERTLSQLADPDEVTRWIRDPALTSPAGIFGSPRMWVMLRMLPGFDLPNFLAGTRLAYGTVTRLMYTRDWDGLRPLVSPEMLSAMQETMDQFGGEGRRVMDVEEEDAIVVESAVLREVQVLQEQDDDESAGRRRCHMDVLITAHEKWSLFDYHEQEPVPPFDGRVRVQETTWRFEGVCVAKPGMVGAGSGDGSGAAASSGDYGDEDGTPQWTVHSIV